VEFPWGRDDIAGRGRAGKDEKRRDGAGRGTCWKAAETEISRLTTNRLAIVPNPLYIRLRDETISTASRVYRRETARHSMSV